MLVKKATTAHPSSAERTFELKSGELLPVPPTVHSHLFPALTDVENVFSRDECYVLSCLMFDRIIMTFKKGYYSLHGQNRTLRITIIADVMDLKRTIV